MMGLYQGYSSAFDRAIIEQKPIYTPLHVEFEYLSPHFYMVVPLFFEEGNQGFIGALVLVSNATQFLYPLIQSWPTPSKTAETLLVRRDGDNVLFLNELRHKEGTALKLRIPLSRADLPAAMAVIGREGIVQGKDYRGVEVVAAIMAIPDSPWFMVAKMDATEAFAKWRFYSTMILVFILGVMGFIVVVGFNIRQRILNAYYNELYQSESELRQAMERHSITLNAIGDAVIATDAQSRVEFMNPVAERLTGWSQREALGKYLNEVFQIVNEETRKTMEDPLIRVLKEGNSGGPGQPHSSYCQKMGGKSPSPTAGRLSRMKIMKLIGVVLVFKDQTEEREYQDKIIESEKKISAVIRKHHGRNLGNEL